VHTGFWERNLKEGEHLEDPGINGRIILGWNSRKCDGEAWTGLMAQDMDSWRSFVYVIMNLQVP
jgi:hypothetical protein